MKEDKQRIALAKWMGWTDVGYHYIEFEDVLYGYNPKNPDYIYHKPAPDYLHDLNAVREVEMRLWENETHTELEEGFGLYDEYCRELREVLGRDALIASAHTRCEALLKTIKLWEE